MDQISRSELMSMPPILANAISGLSFVVLAFFVLVGILIVGRAIIVMVEGIRSSRQRSQSQRVLDEVLAERGRQIRKGYTHDHDDQHGLRFGLRHLVSLADSRLQLIERQGLVEAAALLVAAIEVIDRAHGVDERKGSER